MSTRKQERFCPQDMSLANRFCIWELGRDIEIWKSLRRRKFSRVWGWIRNIYISISINVLMTTIAVSQNTLQVLTRIKERMKARSLEEAIKRLMQKHEKIPISRFGSQKKLKEFRKEERVNSHEL